MRRVTRPPALFKRVVRGDPYLGNVVLLLDASARSNGSTPSDIDATGKTPTWRGNAQCVTSIAKFGTSCMYFDGTNDRVSFPDSADWAPGLGDYTVEAWAYPDTGADSAIRCIVGQSDLYNGFYPFSLRRETSGAMSAWVTNGTTTYGATIAGTLPIGQWTHVVLVRAGASLYAYVGGTRYTAATGIGSVTLLDSTGALAVGAYADFDASTADWLGGIDQLRITKGVARYTDATIAVPTAPFPKG